MKHMTPREAYEGLLWAYREVSSLGMSWRRAWRTLRNTGSLFSTAIAFSWNDQAYRTITHWPAPPTVISPLAEAIGSEAGEEQRTAA